MSNVSTFQGSESGPASSSERFSVANAAMLVWLFILASFLSVRERAASELLGGQGFDLQIKLQIAAWIALGFLALYLFFKQHVDLRFIGRAPLCWYCAYAIAAIVSSAYSVSPALTLFRAGQLMIVIFLVVSLRKRLDRIYVLILAFMVINWIFVLMANLRLDFGQAWIRGPENSFLLFDRGTSEPWRFSSPIAHASQVSIVGAAGAVGLAMRTNKKSLKDNLPIILFFALTVVLTVSRTAIAAMFLGFFIVLVVRRRAVPALLLAGFLLPLMMVFTPVGEKVVNFGMRGQSAEEFKSLTGRSDIYRFGVSRALDSMPLGEGFVAGRAKAIVAKDKGRSIVHSHNLFIESAVGMGVLGIALALMVLASLARALILATRHSRGPRGVSPGWEPVVMSIPILSFCILDRGFASPVSPFVCLFVAVLVLTTQLLVEQESALIDAGPSSTHGAPVTGATT